MHSKVEVVLAKKRKKMSTKSDTLSTVYVNLSIAVNIIIPYGNLGNWSKSGSRFSLNASLPSFASSVV